MRATSVAASHPTVKLSLSIIAIVIAVLTNSSISTCYLVLRGAREPELEAHRTILTSTLRSIFTLVHRSTYIPPVFQNHRNFYPRALCFFYFLRLLRFSLIFYSHQFVFAVELVRSFCSHGTVRCIGVMTHVTNSPRLCSRNFK
ncbi:hypothetical protein DFH29DRAFT_79316 [Suillus ampliporus]|nr:hypothetical protein DFH29DRAFT_79316 [Suillus ampliporus]